jgi:hypothetical protein
MRAIFVNSLYSCSRSGNHNFKGTGGYGIQVERAGGIGSADIDVLGFRNQRLRIQQQLQRQRSNASNYIDRGSADHPDHPDHPDHAGGTHHAPDNLDSHHENE